MPLHLEFVNMSVEQLEIFEDLLTTLEDAKMRYKILLCLLSRAI